MRHVIHQGFREFEFLRWQDSHLLDFRDRFQALDFLRSFRSDPSAMGHLRRLLADEGVFSTVSRLDDEEIIEQIATLLTNGRMRVLARHETIEPNWLFGTAPEPEPPVPPAAEPEAASAAVAEEPPAEVDPAIVAAAENQAAILTSAAVKGSPLCEA